MTNESDEALYRRALEETKALAEDPHNRGQKAGWWHAVHEMVRKHHKGAGTACAKCGDPWPCGAVTGALKDVESGSLGY